MVRVTVSDRRVNLRMYFFVNQGIGHSNSGVEHAQFYRAARFREQGLPFKLVFTDHLPQLHQHMSEWQLAEHEVIGLYDYLLSDDPDDYLQQGTRQPQVYYEESLWDTEQTQRLLFRQATGRYTETIQRRKRRTRDGEYVVVDDRVILENQQHRVAWHYQYDGENGKRPVNIHVDNFRGQHYLFTTQEELLTFFFAELQRYFTQNVYFVDRGVSHEAALISLKQAGSPLQLGVVIHAAHFVGFVNGHPLWNTYYQYLFDHLAVVDVIIVSTHQQREDILSQLQTLGVSDVADKIVVIPVGGVPAIAPARHWQGHTAKFVTAARLHVEKNLTHVIMAVKQLRDAGMPLTLAIYGVGQEYTPLAQFIQTHQLADVVKLKGLSQDVLADMQQYDAFVSASYSEGFGLAYLEAMSLGLPIATYANRYGAQTLVRDGENGYLAAFEPQTTAEAQNITHLAAAMRRIFDNYDALSRGASRRSSVFLNADIARQWGRLVEALR